MSFYYKVDPLHQLEAGSYISKRKSAFNNNKFVNNYCKKLKMAEFFTKVGNVVRGTDLFGVPVQLTYKGRTTFNTICGGCLSILLVIGLVVYFALEFHQEWLHPRML